MQQASHSQNTPVYTFLAMTTPLLLSVLLLSFANGANDNFKGVATLWGSGLTSYRRAIAWATAFKVDRKSVV